MNPVPLRGLLVCAIVLVSCTGSTEPVVGPAPLPSLVAITVPAGAPPIPAQVRARVTALARGKLAAGTVFPLPNLARDDVAALDGLDPHVVIRWFDPLTRSTGIDAPRFGANCDYVAYFGDGWNADWDGDIVGSAPQFRGSATRGMLWVNHEYIANAMPMATTAPTGQCLTLARFLKSAGVLAGDVTSDRWSQSDLDRFIEGARRQLGGSWLRVVRDARSGRWSVDRSAPNLRYDATAATQVEVRGARCDGVAGERAAGISSDCAGGQTPWGTVISAEENVQELYGDLENCWSPHSRFLRGQGFDPGTEISFTAEELEVSRSSPFGQASKQPPGVRRDLYGYLCEMDPGVDPGRAYRNDDAVGHRKLGFMGRARWESAAIAVGRDLRLLPAEPIAIYGGDDRHSGRIFKWVTNAVYQPGMTRAAVRRLLEDGRLFVAHFEGLDPRTGKRLAASGALPSETQPGRGRWIELSVSSLDIAPNAEALGRPGTTVGDALLDLEYNGMGAFPDDRIVRLALFTACNKIGITELNRPEDVEWNARDPSGRARLYVAFTTHVRRLALDPRGVLIDPDRHDLTASRKDDTGSVFALEELDPVRPGRSREFLYFCVWDGRRGTGAFDAAHPDNLMIDSAGGLWFGTDGNIYLNGTADALYYLDLDPAHRKGQPGIVNPTFGRAFRVLAGPADSEVTGPALSSDERTLFISIQHPGESLVRFPDTQWPPR